MRALVLTCIFSVVGIQSVSGQKAPDIPTTVDAAVKASQQSAQAALETLRKLVNASNARAMGFESERDVASATLGDPLVIFYVRLDHLREYQPKSDPLPLLSGGDRVLYPVSVRGQTRSSITLARSAEGWKGVSYGGPNNVQLVSQVVSESSHGALQSRRPFLVDVLALGVHFVGFDERGKLMLVPLLDDSQQRWKAGGPRPADEVFAQLVGDAKSYNELPL